MVMYNRSFSSAVQVKHQFSQCLGITLPLSAWAELCWEGICSFPQQFFSKWRRMQATTATLNVLIIPYALIVIQHEQCDGF